MAASQVEPVDPGQQLVTESLLDLYDDLVEFERSCTFLLDAFASLAAEDEAWDNERVDGFKTVSGWMKDQLRAYRKQVKTIHNQAAPRQPL